MRPSENAFPGSAPFAPTITATAKKVASHLILRASADGAENFKTAINDFLAKRGHLCLAQYDWPIYVTADDQAAKSRNAIQMPVLGKLGIAAGEKVVVERKDETGHTITANAREYDLTTEGQK